MALWAYALRTVAATKAGLVITGSAIDSLIEDCVNQASQIVEDAWGRHIVSRGSLTEYHPKETSALALQATVGRVFAYDLGGPFLGPPSSARTTIYMNEFPIVSVASVNEDTSRVYGAGSLLTVNTDYIVSNPTGKLVRVMGSLPASWSWSWRAVKVAYIAGYQNTSGSISGADAVPYAILRVFDELVAWMIDQRAPGPKRQVGMNSVSDGLGNRSFSGPAYITPGMQAALDSAGALPVSVRSVTGERDT
jgi:hypothetical protein